MGRAPCCDKANVKKGPWSPEEDAKLKDYIEEHGTGGNWISLPQKAGLRRCGKSCRLRWLNYLRPNIKHGQFSDDEDRIICTLFATIGSRWSIIAGQLPGRTDNDIKNYWNTKLKKKMFGQSLLQSSSPASSTLLYNCSSISYHTPARYSSSFSNNSATASCISASSVIPMQQQYQLQDGSCSSNSDGSCSNQFSQQSKELEYRYGDHQQQIGMQSYSSYTEADDDDNQNKLIIGSSNGGSANEWYDQKSAVLPTNEAWGETPLDYGLEEIKQLISTGSCNSNSFIFYENNAEEKVMYY